MKILFVHANIGTQTLPHFVPGLGSLSAYLKREGHETGLIALNTELERDAFLAQVREAKPDLIGFSTLTNQWSIIRRYTGWVREALNVPIIHGGVHVTVDPESALQAPEIDLLCVGEGEGAMLDLVRRLERGQAYDDVANLWLKKPDGRILRNPLRPLIQNLDDLPIPDRDLFDYRRLLKENPLNATLLMVGRGCPFKCRYCVNNHLHRLYRGQGRFVRLRSQESVLAEVHFLVDHYHLDRLWIYDDTFTYDHRWLRRFCERYGQEIKLPFRVNVRVDTVDEPILAMLKAAGCEMIVAGIESGSERVRREVMGRHMSNRKIIDTYAAARRLGLKTWAYYIFGSPTETPAEAEETLALHELVKPDIAQASIFYPYPGTELHEYCRTHGYLTGQEHTNFFDGVGVVNNPQFTAEQLHSFVNRLYDAHGRHLVEQNPRGVYDFLVHYPQAEIRTENADYVRLTAALIGEEERRVLFAHPESTLTYRLNIPPHARLSFGIGLYPEAWSPDKGSGVHFAITLAINGLEEKIFDVYIDPKSDPRDRKWHDYEIPLPASGPEPAILRLITTTRGKSKAFCWAFWTHPAVYAGVDAG